MPPPIPLAQYIPLNPQEHDNELRTIINKHMGLGQGNPSQWVVDAMHEVWQRAFGLGFNAGVQTANAPPAPAPAFKVRLPPPPPARYAAPDDVIEG